MNDPYENLANAIILQAANDYRAALRTLERNPKYAPALQDKSEVERFFRSEWYKLLTSVDGETLLRMLREEVA